MSKSVGYARVSSSGQNLARQKEALLKYVPEEMIVTDKVSGKDTNRPGYQSLKHGHGKLKEGDTLYVKSIDRLARNKADCKDELNAFKEAGVRVKIIDIPTTMMDFPENQAWVQEMINNVIIEVLASVAENERNEIRQRQAEGIAAMPSVDGKKISMRTKRATGRPKAEFPVNWGEVYTAWKKGSVTAVDAMKLLQVKKNTFYNLVKRYENALDGTEKL